MIRIAPSSGQQDGRSCNSRTAPQNDRRGPGSSRQRIDDGEIAGPVAAEKALRVKQVENTGCQQKEGGKQTELRPCPGQDPDGEGRKQQRFGGRRKPDEVLAVSCPLGQEIPRGVGK